MKRPRFLASAVALSIAGDRGSASAETQPKQDVAMPRQAHEFFRDADMNYVFLGMLGGAYYGLADVGTALAIIDQTEDGNAASAFTALTSAGEIVRARAATALAGGHHASARASFLQASNYTFAATYFCDGMSAPEKLIPTWKRSRSDVDAAFALFDPPVEAVKIPYEGTTLPGYIFKVDDGGKRRPLLIMVNGSDGSILDMWLFGAAAAVQRGYNCIAVDGPGLRLRLIALAIDHHRYGFPRLTVLLRRQGFADNRKRIHRVYVSASLQVQKRVKRKLSLGRGPVDAPALAPNDRWSLDFVHDRLRTNRRSRILGVGDDRTRENLALEVDFALSGERMTRVLDDIALSRDYPKTIVLDNGPEMRSLAMLGWPQDRGVRLDFIQHGKPVQNGILPRASTAAFATSA